MSCVKAFLLGGFVIVVACLARPVQSLAAQKEASTNTTAQPVLQTELMPIYGLDFNFKPEWVDGASFPSSSPEFPNQGVSNVFQQAWEAIKPSGFGVIRFVVDVRDGSQAASRIANLCLWSQGNGVRIIPVLVGAEHEKSSNEDFARSAGAFVTSLLRLLVRHERDLTLYNQIVAYQIEDQLNHVALHQSLFPQHVPPMLRQTSAEIRRAEQAGFPGAPYQATPLLVNFSFDFELILEQGIAGFPMSENLLDRAYLNFRKRYLANLRELTEIDVIDVQWLAGSLGGGGPEFFSSLLERLVADLPGKQLLFTTGCSTACRSQDDQVRFASLSFTNLAGFRATVGANSPFLGLMLREAFSRTNEESRQRDTSGWNWQPKAYDVIDTWSAKRPSQDAIWWLDRAVSNLGLFTVKTDNSGNSSLVGRE